MDYATRVRRLWVCVEAAGLDAVVYGSGANFEYLSGRSEKWVREHEPAEPEQLLIISGGQAFIVKLATGDDIRERLARYISGSRVGVSRAAARYLSDLLVQAIPGVSCVDAESLGAGLRLVKDDHEVSLLRKAASLTDKVMAEVVELIRPGVTQLELQARIEEIGLGLGAEDVSFPPAALFVKSGTTPTENPFVYAKDMGLVPGTSIAFDFGFVVNGYCSDFGRSFYCGPAPSDFAKAYRSLQKAQCHLISQMRPGMRIGDMYGVLMQVLDGDGYGDRFRARVPDGTLGHQIGVDLHEDPWIRPGVEKVLEPGMVMAIEPKLWLPGEYYLRVEDIVLVTERGAEPLTLFDRNLFELGV